MRAVREFSPREFIINSVRETVEAKLVELILVHDDIRIFMKEEKDIYSHIHFNYYLKSKNSFAFICVTKVSVLYGNNINYDLQFQIKDYDNEVEKFENHEHMNEFIMENFK